MSTIENVALTMKIKGALLLDDQIGATNLDVDTVDEGVVHLRGSVPTNVEGLLAVDLAGRMGAHRVVNELTYDREMSVTAEESPAAAGVYGRVTTSAGAPSTGRPPLKMAVADALASDPRVNEHLLEVEILHDGRVELTGRQGTVQQRDAALEVASKVPGVFGVIDGIEIQPAY